MTTAELQICNKALARLGAGIMTSLDENTKNAKVINLFYDGVRQSLLKDLNPSFAIERATLAKISDYKPAFGYKHAFALPDKCLNVLSIGYPMLDEHKQIEGNKLFCDYESLVDLRYIKDIDDVSQYDADFSKLFYLSLASEICMEITQDPEKSSYMEQLVQDQYVKTSCKYGRDNKVVIINKPRFQPSKICGPMGDYVR